MERKDLLEVTRRLNGIFYKGEDGEDILLIKEKVKTVGVSSEELASEFIRACERIPKDKEEFLPDDIADAYNKMVDEMANDKKGDTEQAAEDSVSPSTSSKSGKKKGGAATEGTKESGGKGSGAKKHGAIERARALLREKTPEKEIVGIIAEEFKMDEKRAKGRLIAAKNTL